MGAIPGSREPDPQAVPALTGFDPERRAEIAAKAIRIRKVAAALAMRYPDIPELDAIYVMALGIRNDLIGATRPGRVKR
jgi:hypothetical protein